MRFFIYTDCACSLAFDEVVTADNITKAFDAFRDLMEEDEKSDANIDYIQEIGNPDMRFGPRPKCCSSAVYGLPDRYRSNRGYNDERLIKLGVCSDSKNPIWKIEPGFQIYYCPWCGVKLPEVEINPDPPRPLQTANDPDNGYCATCDERHVNCQCHPYTWAWVVK